MHCAAAVVKIKRNMVTSLRTFALPQMVGNLRCRVHDDGNTSATSLQSEARTYQDRSLERHE
jgi:hypothetical protein